MQGRDRLGALSGGGGTLSRLRPAAALALPAVLAHGAPSPGAAAQLPPPPPAYYRAVVVGGMAFPVARSNWFSVIEFEDDWHEPRLRLIGGRWRQVGVHEGNDIGAEKGTPVLSATAGTVEAVGWTFYSGDRVGVRGVDGRYYFYAHLSAFAPGIEVGAAVEAGTILGRVGNTGYGPYGHEDEFPPHLHFGIQGAEGWVNPYPVLVEIYRRSVAATMNAERRLARLAREGKRAAFRRAAERLYLDGAAGNNP